MRGRVRSVNYLFVNASNQLGAFESGIAAAWWCHARGADGRIGSVLIALLWMRLFPTLRDVERAWKAPPNRTPADRGLLVSCRRRDGSDGHEDRRRSGAAELQAQHLPRRQLEFHNLVRPLAAVVALVRYPLSLR